MDDALKIRAEDVEDLAVIAALVQDARTRLRDMVFDDKEHRFMAAFTRYRRERQPDPSSNEGLTERPTALLFDCVDEVKHRNIDTSDFEQPLDLMTIATEPGSRHLFHITLIFDQEREIQLRADCLDVRLDDFGEVKPASRLPYDHFITGDVVLGHEGEPGTHAAGGLTDASETR